MPELYDAIVIGGGPAGGSAAYFLAQAGMKALVLEKEAPPRYKACGGGLSAGLLKQFPFSFEPVIETQARSIAYTLRGRTVRMPLPPQAMQLVMRADFDAHLLAHSQAEVRTGVAVRKIIEEDDRVTVETAQGERLAARYLVGADGASSLVARQLGLRRGKLLAAAIEVEAPAPPEVFARFESAPLFIFGEVRLGYLWVFPKRQHLSVGIGALHPMPGELQNTLKRVMARYGIALDGLPLHGHPLPVYTRRERLVTRRALLVGDAAGLIDPFSGEGIRFAIKSGRLAAQAILAGDLERYQAQVQRTIGWNHLLGAALALLFYHAPGPCFQLGVRNPFATQAFVEMLSDRAGYGEVILRLFGTLPLFLLTEAAAGLAGLAWGPRGRQRVREAVYGTT